MPDMLRSSWKLASTQRPSVKDRLALRWRLGGLLAAVLVIVALPYVVTRSGSSEAIRPASA